MTVAAAIAVLAAGGCRVMHHEETAGQYVDDSTIKARAKAALIRDKEVSATGFTVEVYQGRVTLTGVARTSEEAHRAAEDIRAVPGVKSVQNETRIAEAPGAGAPR